MPLYHIKHITRYTYGSAVIDSANQIMLYPVNDNHQLLHAHDLSITAKPDVDTYYDYFGNKVGNFSIVQPHISLCIESNVQVETRPISIPVIQASVEEQWQLIDTLQHTIPYLQFVKAEKTNVSSELQKVIHAINIHGESVLTVLQQFSSYVFTNFTYQKGVTSVETSLDEIWKLKAGVCQDFAHLLLEMLRMCSIPARYVSGYICPENHELRGEGATHAWVEAYIPFFGWLGIDPTNNCFVSDRHVRLAIGRNFSDCTPVKGTYKGTAEHTLEVSVVINGEQSITEDHTPPSFAYVAHQKNESSANSYRIFMEMQQQQ